MPDRNSSSGSFSVLCTVNLGNDKKSTIYEVTSSSGGCIQKPFADYENLYERIKHRVPSSIDKVPKKKIFLGEAKLHEKRRAWIESLVNHLLNNEMENQHVQNFFASLINDKSENHINLGPSERRMIPADFDILGVIGKGSFGCVYRVRQIATKKVYAMKVLGKEHIKMRKEEKHVMAEKNVLKSNVNHPFLVSLHFSFQTRTKLFFILDYVNGGELFMHLQREKNFSENRAKFYAAEIACALGYLHENDIIYRDLKPENLLLDRYGHVVLTDFGLCKEGIKLKDTTATFCGTPEYLAPEVIQKKAYDRTVDWWCLGSVLYEMLFGLPPFYSKNQKEMYERILKQPLTLSSLASNPSRDILQSLLQKDRHKRLGARRDFEEIKEHEFFSSINWEKLLRREIKPTFVPKIKSEADDSLVADEFKRIKPNLNSLVNGTTCYEQDTTFLGFTYNVQNHLDTVNV
jgi:serine/threonine protein kinase